jgi:hypothetical protein
MILGRVGSLIGFARGVRKGRFGDAMAALSLEPIKRNRAKWDKAKSASSKWLEFHFGWSPLIGDIYDGMTVLTSAWKDLPVKTSAKTRYNGSYPPPGDYSMGVTQILDYRVRNSSEVRITNPNLYQLSQWGLTNPLEVAWELVPFSFVVDWFTNVGSLIGSMSDLHGVTLVNAYHSIYCSNTSYVQYWRGPNQPFASWRANGYGYQMDRISGLSKPQGFYIKPFVGFSVSRGATAIALLVGMMPRK